MKTENMTHPVLYYGYHPGDGSQDLLAPINNALSAGKIDPNESGLHEKGLTAFRDAVNDELQDGDLDKPQVVPLSSGLDSRTILCALLEHPELSEDQIQTVTFGTPGTWDYEIGRLVARHADVAHKSIDLTSDEISWSIESLEQYAATRDWPIPMFEGYINASILNYVPNNAQIWSGVLGETSTGSHLPESRRSNWEDALDYFARTNRASARLAPPSFHPHSLLPEAPYFPRDQLCFEEQVDLAVRQPRFILQTAIADPERYRTPFLNEHWLSFSLNLSDKHRFEQRFFLAMVQKAFPDLFELPSQANKGLPLNTNPLRKFFSHVGRELRKQFCRRTGIPFVRKGMNYIDFTSALREYGPFARTVFTLVDAYDRRDLHDHINIDTLPVSHRNGEDLSTELRILTSLELFLRTHD